MTQQWNGYSDATSDIGDGMIAVENVSFLVNGELGRRPGLGAQIVDSGWVAGEVGSYAILARSDGKIDAVNQTSGAVATLTAGYDTTNRPVMAQAFQRLYITNNVDAMKASDDGTYVRAVGIAAPGSAPIASVAADVAGVVTAGTHLLRYRYQDQTRTRLSDPTADATAIMTTTGTGGVLHIAVNSTGNLTVVGVATSGSGYSDPVGVDLSPGSGTGGVVTISTSGGALTGGVVVSAGSGYLPHSGFFIPNLIAAHRFDVPVVASTDPYVTHIIIEMTPAGASTFYRAATVVNSTGTVQVNISDADLIQQVPATRDGEFSHDQPPLTPLIIEHRNRVWWWGTTGQPAVLGWSRAGYPESFDAVNYARLVSLDSGDTPAAQASYYSDLYLIGQRSMRRFVFTSDPASGMILTVPGVQGAFNQRCICPAGSGLLFGWGRDGVWRINAMQPEKISQNIEQSLAAVADNTQLAQRFVVYEPVQREVACFFCAVGDTACKLAFIWHIDRQEWSLWRFRQAMTAGCQNSAYTDRQRLMLCDANGYSWRAFSGYNDGFTGNGVVTATGGSTTVVNGTNGAIVGEILYRPATAEERLITAVTGTTMTVAALATAPTVGETFYVGSIRQRWISQWTMLGDMGDRKRPARFRITARPNNQNGQAMGLVKVYFYRDFLTTPTAIGSGYAMTDVNYSGVSTGSNYVQVDLDAAMSDGNGAFISLPTPAEWARAWQIEITAETPRDGVRLFDIQFEMDDGNAGPGQEG